MYTCREVGGQKRPNLCTRTYWMTPNVRSQLNIILEKCICNFPMQEKNFSNFSSMFLSKSKIIFSNLTFNCSNLLDMTNLQERVKKAFCYQQLFWRFTALFEWIVQVISKILQILGLQPRISKVFFSIARTIYSQSRSEQFS